MTACASSAERADMVSWPNFFSAKTANVRVGASSSTTKMIAISLARLPKESDSDDLTNLLQPAGPSNNIHVRQDLGNQSARLRGLPRLQYKGRCLRTTATCQGDDRRVSGDSQAIVSDHDPQRAGKPLGDPFHIPYATLQLIDLPLQQSNLVSRLIKLALKGLVAHV